MSSFKNVEKAKIDNVPMYHWYNDVSLSQAIKIIAHFFCTFTNYCYLCIKYRRYVVKTALALRGLNP